MATSGVEDQVHGYALLIAASPPARHRAVSAADALPALAAVPPATLLGTATASVVQLVDPDDPQTVLTHLRTAAAHQGPLLVYLSGQLVLDAKQRLPHLALARTTPKAARYTALPWHWLIAELQYRPQGTTTVFADLVADETAWASVSRRPDQLASPLALYGAVAPPPPKRSRTPRTPRYSQALASLLRGLAERPPLGPLHEAAVADARLTGQELLLGGAPHEGGLPHGNGHLYGNGLVHEGGFPEAAGLPGRGTVASTPVPLPGQGHPGDDAPANGAQNGAAAGTAPGGFPYGNYGNGSGTGTGTETGPPGASGPGQHSFTGPPPEADADASSPVETTDTSGATDTGSPAAADAPDEAPTRPSPEEAPDDSPRTGEVPVGTLPPPPMPSPPLPAMPPLPPMPPGPPPVAQPLPQARPEPDPEPEEPEDPHAAIFEAARAGHHSQAAAMAAAWEQAALRAHGPDSAEAIHWVEVRADLARLAGEPDRSCSLWMVVASTRLMAGQRPEQTEVANAVDRAHHCWHLIDDPGTARELGLELAPLRQRVPGGKPGAVEDVQGRLNLLVGEAAQRRP
ncbi:hypothetical protein [Streptomyces daliensis]